MEYLGDGTRLVTEGETRKQDSIPLAIGFLYRLRTSPCHQPNLAHALNFIIHVGAIRGLRQISAEINIRRN